jgi:Polyketide cyclase / dehydrase and lipid transport
LSSPDGIGAIRRFTAFGVGSREEVVAWVPPFHLGYSILSGFPVRHYRADVTLTPDEGGTTLTWSVSFDAKLRGTGPIMYAVLGLLISRFCTGVTSYADRHPDL